MYKIGFDNRKNKKIVTEKVIEKLIACFLEECEIPDVKIEDVKEIFVHDDGTYIRYFFWDYNYDMIFEKRDKKSDLKLINRKNKKRRKNYD